MSDGSQGEGSGRQDAVIPTMVDIRVLEGEDPKKLRLGWKIVEETGPSLLPSDDDSCYGTDKADLYMGSHGRKTEEDADSVWGVVPQLEFLWGQPWNNLALDYVMALRPSAVRVTADGITLDAQTWRVTVWLEKDKRTIRRIEQECSLGAIGASCGHDLMLKLEQQKTGERIAQFDASVAFVNTEALGKTEIGGGK